MGVVRGFFLSNIQAQGIFRHIIIATPFTKRQTPNYTYRKKYRQKLGFLENGGRPTIFLRHTKPLCHRFHTLVYRCQFATFLLVIPYKPAASLQQTKLSLNGLSKLFKRLYSCFYRYSFILQYF